jgi:hypothetical protein
MARRFHNRLPGPDIATRSIRGRNRATTDPRAAIDHRSARFAGAWVGYLARGLLISLGFVVVPQPPERRRVDCLWITPAARGAAPVCEQIIKGTAARTPDPISRNRRPAIGNPPAIPVLPPMRRSHSPMPLAQMTGRRMPARTTVIAHLPDPVPAPRLPARLAQRGRVRPRDTACVNRRCFQPQPLYLGSVLE